MNAVTCMLLLAVAFAAGKELNVARELFSRKSFCAGATDVSLRCADGGEPFRKYKMAGLDVRVFTSDSASKSCKTNEKFASRNDLCSKDLLAMTEHTALYNSVYSSCIGQSACSFSLPSSDQLYAICDGKSYFYGIELEIQCTELVDLDTAPEVPTGAQGKRGSRIFRRSIYNSREQTRNSNFDSREHQSNLKTTRSGNDKSAQSTNNKKHDIHSTEAHNSRNSNNLNSFESKNDKDNSRDQGNSHEFGRYGNRRRNGQKVISYDKNGQPVYGSQRSGANEVKFGVVLFLVAFTLAMFLN